jgi:O-antigen/teichoic acid export membrane protein
MSVNSTPRLHETPSTGRLVRYTGWNLFGFCAPMLVALAAIPILTRQMGDDRFGALALVWMLVGYFTLFDLGLGRAMTRLTAAKLARQEEDEVPGVFWTALGLMFLLGLAGAALLIGLTPKLVHEWLKIPSHLQGEVLWSFLASAVGLPVVVMTASLIGVLEAYQRFRLINIIRVPMGIYTFAGPLCVLPFSHGLFPMVVVLIVGRVIEWSIYFVYCLRAVPALRQECVFRRDWVRPLFAVGGWMTVSNIAMPLLVHMDRFLIGRLVAMSAVAFYATVAEVVVKLLIFPRAWVSVLFPSFTAQHVTQSQGAAGLYARGIKGLMLFSFPIVLTMSAFAGEGLQLWLGSRYAAQSMSAMRWLTAGLFVYSLSYVPYSLLQGVGRADKPAILHLVELVGYVVFASFMIRRFGIEGAAIAWFIRSMIEAFIMSTMAHRYVPDSGRDVARSGVVVAVALLMLGGAAMVSSLWLRLVIVPAELAIFAVLSWRWLLSGDERDSFACWVREHLPAR